MALKRSFSLFQKPDFVSNKVKQDESEEDLYFEMEYPEVSRSRSGTWDSDSVSFSSQSVESLPSDYPIQSQHSLSGQTRRGASVEPILERPKSLKYTPNCKRNISIGSLTRPIKTTIPKPSFTNSSLPNNPTDFWESENNFLKNQVPNPEVYHKT